MTPEQAYAEDVARCPLYHDGTPRRPWHALPEYARDSWARNPTPRTYARTPCRWCHQQHAPVLYADTRAACDAARVLGPEYVADGHAGAWRVYDDAGRVLHDDGRCYAEGVGGFCYAVEVRPRPRAYRWTGTRIRYHRCSAGARLNPCYSQCATAGASYRAAHLIKIWRAVKSHLEG